MVMVVKEDLFLSTEDEIFDFCPLNKKIEINVDKRRITIWYCRKQKGLGANGWLVVDKENIGLVLIAQRRQLGVVANRRNIETASLGG